MKTLVAVLWALFLSSLFSLSISFESDGAERTSQGEVVLTIVYDNYSADDRLTTDWGFSCLIEGLEKTVLFDTGTQGDILMNNMRILEIDPNRIEAVVLSHFHRDHYGGLEALLAVNSDVDVYVPPVFPEQFKAGVRATGARVHETQEGQQICAGLRSTGQLDGPVIEQGVFLDVKDGLAVITGCAHPLVTNFATKAGELGGRTPFFVMGGFHLVDTGSSRIRQIIEDLQEAGVQRVVPTHCTGDNARAMFQQAFDDGYSPGGVGASYRLELP